MKRIIWFSQHKPLENQITELNRIFGEVEVIQYPNPFESAEVVVDKFKKLKGDDMVVVAPLSVMMKLIDLGIKPLYAKMDIVKDSKYDVKVKGRKFKFNRFQRVEKIKMIFSELD